ncbi:MAG: hypothetical protein JWO69_1255, partial [Thermoleophilia bacterium]|nr:hypothetical protein [Thermoleophilia bacterium]
MRIAALVSGSSMHASGSSPRLGAAAPSANEATLIERMQAQKTLRHVEVLNRTSRGWKSPGYDRAVDYVIEQMRAAGWDVRVEELETKTWMGTGKLRNVIAERRGTGTGER